jgi:hypothetical protein
MHKAGEFVFAEVQQVQIEFGLVNRCSYADAFLAVGSPKPLVF